MRKLVALAVTLFLLLGSCPVGAAALTEAEVKELSLEECLKLAEQNNESIKLAEASLEQAKVGLKQAAEQDKKLRRAERDIDNSRQLTGSDSPLPDPARDEIRDAIWQAERALAGFDVQLFREMGLWAAEEQKKIAQQGYELSYTGVHLKVTQAYHDLFKAEKDIELAEAAHKAASEYARITDLQVELGLATEAQRISAQKTLADSIAAKEGAQAMYEAKKAALLKEIGLDFNTNIKLTAPALEDEEFDFDSLLHEAMAQNISIRAAKFQSEVAERKLGFLGSWYSPRVYEYQNAEVQAQEYRAKLSDTERSVENSVRSSYNLFLAAKEQLPAAEKAVIEAQENLRVTELKFKTGMAAQIEVLQAKQKLAQAESNLTNVQKNYALATASLKAAQEGLVLLTSQGSESKSAVAFATLTGGGFN
ncbi:MAG: TolC family protein [Firmicutes bacterium]|jgi:outer membrane protein TolC|nr:TolC family protein [Bacillota bacterium]